MKLETKAVHWGDRRRKAAAFTPTSTPIYASSSYLYNSMEQLDRVLGREEEGASYARYDNPTRAALEELVRELEGGAGAVACSSGMAALHLAVLASLVDRPRRVLAAAALYGSTTNMLMTVFGAIGVEATFVDICDFAAVEEAIAKVKPGAIVMETISNPLLRVGELDKIAQAARAAGAVLIVDNTFATPLLVRPLTLGAGVTVHSATKYLAGHGDVLGGVVVADKENFEPITALARTLGPVMSPFESYLTMRGIKTLPLRFERQCGNACKVASWLASHSAVERVYFTGDPAHPDAAAIQRLFPRNLYGAMVSFEIKGARRQEVFRFMDRLKMIVCGTSLGDVHTMTLYPAIASHRELSPKRRQQLGINDNLIRLSIGIEAAEDIVADLEQAFEN
ncbi:MAG TPA: PLP-dependent aspartate aminotransferase family protein [Bryobacteraceae bacterium]|nr:PLP-dependent aspartate aminotransferase family protein [Bryobacteraceae bacterium]